jgi:Fringe-like
MSICYIILTCELYIPTRAKYLLETSLKNVNPNDIYFLSCKSSQPNVYGWNTADNYESCPLKYVRFFQNMKLDYDWYYFMDDDTFVFPNRLSTFLQQYNKNDRLYIGNRCTHVEYHLYMSGGAGFLLTKSVYFELIDYIKSKNDHELITERYGDYLMGIWLSNIPNKKIVSIDLFKMIRHENDEELINFISFHYLKTKEHYDFYNSILIQE